MQPQAVLNKVNKQKTRLSQSHVATRCLFFSLERAMRFVGHGLYLIGMLIAFIFGALMQSLDCVPIAARDPRTTPEPCWNSYNDYIWKNSAEFKPAQNVARRDYLAIVTMAVKSDNKDYAKVASYSISNHLEYCYRHKYPFFFWNDPLIDYGKTPHWSKMPILHHYMERYEWVFWTDVDVLVMNMSIPLESFIDDRYELIISHDMHGFNNGNFFVRSTPFGYAFLQETWDVFPLWQHDTFPEQNAMLHVLSRWEKRNATMLKEKVKILSQRSFNSYIDSYQPGDFQLHFVGGTKSLMSQYFRKRPSPSDIRLAFGVFE